MAHRFEHAPHLAVAPLSNRELDDAFALPATIVQQRRLGRQRPVPVERNTFAQLA
jgi:hypothetical protein